ncbi:MAG: hypothetical protein JWR40_558 [Massilia sp.]|jgi:hypothetical protein|nr:hypothetical protein [Massilia sp.]MDB5951429.1 hypothetical protein [Massilia sp.]
MGKWTKYIWTLIATVPLAVQAQIDLTVLDRDMAGPRAQVLVLGSIHLRYLPTSFNPASLDGVLDRLAAFKPDIVTIETQSGEECDLFARHPAKYGNPYNCTSTDAAKEATGLDVPAAIAEVNRTLKSWPAQPAAAQRRRLAAAFLAASDSASAYVQWLQLPVPERRTGEGLNPALVAQLEQMATRNSEQLQVAARLAARLGLQRVYATDNHTGDNIDIEDGKAFGQAMTQAWAAGRTALKKEDKQTEVLQQASDLLPLYRHINSSQFQSLVADGEVRSSMRANSPKSYPQMWVAGWEIRNLRMIANIRETFRERPGARVVSIVGYAHKPWYDAWLGQLQGVDIVDVAGVLTGKP